MADFPTIISVEATIIELPTIRPAQTFYGDHAEPNDGDYQNYIR